MKDVVAPSGATAAKHKGRKATAKGMASPPFGALGGIYTLPFRA